MSGVAIYAPLAFVLGFAVGLWAASWFLVVSRERYERAFHRPDDE
jgi:hypothetical protein